MQVLLHRLVRQDVRTIMDYYEKEADPRLAQEFLDVFMAKAQQAAGNPRRFPFINKLHRRCNLGKFPYHFLYLETTTGVRVLVVRHHRRNPSYGSQRR